MAIGSSSTAPRWKRALIWLVAGILAVAMVFLGLWQMQVFEDRGDRVAQERASAAPIELLPLIPPDGTMGDVLGRPVTVSGTYDPALQVVVVDADGTRRLMSGLLLADGRVLPVVRGVVDGSSHPAPPPGTQVETGVFLPSEPGDPRAVGADELSSVRLPALAQRWPQQLTPGFVTLSEPEAAEQGLRPATVALPDENGAIRNLGYAVQWWVFAVFVVVMAWAITRSMRPKDDIDPVNETD